ncbi:MAG: hotdog domain-containing protein [Thermodesulfobacteriota bacterium]
MEIRTHRQIDPHLCGTPVMVETGVSRVSLSTIPSMAADDRGLIHGGFIFGLADYAAMIAVNSPTVVLGSATVKFLKPVRVHETIQADAAVLSVEGKKYTVSVTVGRGGETVFQGEFICFTLNRHVLEEGRKE